jgi:hypothetical protein
MKDTTRRQSQPDMYGDVPVIPCWIKDWGWIVFAISAIIYCFIAGAVGHTYGVGAGWSLLIAAALGVALLLGADFARRLRSAHARSARALYERLEIAMVVAMGWREFEDWCADLLRARRYAHDERVADTTGQKQVDLIADAPNGARVAVECKHLAKNLGPNPVDRLAGAVTRHPYKGRTGMLITSAYATDGAKTAARDAGIELVDRAVLQQWISEERSNLERRRHERPAHPAVKTLVGVACGFVVLPVIMAFTLPTNPQPSVAAKAPKPAAPSPLPPVVVMREFYAAISQHNWLRVWQLGGKNLGRGPYASYSGMVVGYRDTERDVLKALTVNGDTATGWFLAYQTIGNQPYTFKYVVRDGTITSGYQTPTARH